MRRAIAAGGIAIALLQASGCQQEPWKSSASAGSEGDAWRVEQRKRVTLLYEAADLDVHYQEDGGFFVDHPKVLTADGKSRPLTREEFTAILGTLEVKKSLAVVTMGKRVDPWPPEELDLIEGLLRGLGFREVVFIEARGIGPSPILRGARNVWEDQ